MSVTVELTTTSGAVINAKSSITLAAVAVSGAYTDLTGRPTLGTAAETATTDYATAAQGATANSALQPSGNGSALTGLTKTQVGLANADNTSDANKPVSSATQTALNLKQDIAGTTAATSATTGTMTVNMTTDIVTITPTGSCTFNASGGTTGKTLTFSITTSGVSSFVLTFGTNFRKTGTLATGTVSARFFTVTFRCLGGGIWTEIGRTAVQT